MKYEYKTLALQAGKVFGGNVNNQGFEITQNKSGWEGW